VNHTRLPKEVHLPDCARRDNQVIKGRSCRQFTGFMWWTMWSTSN